MNEGSIDVLQDTLEIEPELFPLSYIDDDGKEIKVITTFKSLRQNDNPLFPSEQPNKFSMSNDIYWTDDKNLEKVFKVYPYSCNKKFSDNENSEYNLYLYRYNCFKNKRIYFISFDNQDKLFNFLDKNMNCNLITPLFSKYTPYKYSYFIKLCNKDFNFFTTYFSYVMLEYIRSTIYKWFDNIKMYIPFKQRLSKIYYDISYLSPDIGQIYFLRFGDNSVPSDIKIQLNIKDEYFFWTIEYIKHNFEKLYKLGLQSFKFSINLGENKIFKYTEFFPDTTDNETNITDKYFNEYYFNDEYYKRELLNGPNIVLYLKDSILDTPGSFGLLLDKLTKMFPDDLDISNGVPRFNIRASKNVYFSLGGGNQFKFSKKLIENKKIPLEYQNIINFADKMNLTEQQFNKLNEYSLYISGHSVLKLDYDRYIKNNILSYLLLLPNSYNSFEQLFNDQLLFKDYLRKFITFEDFLSKNRDIFPVIPFLLTSVGKIVEKKIWLNKYIKYKKKYLNLKNNNLNY